MQQEKITECNGIQVDEYRASVCIGYPDKIRPAPGIFAQYRGMPRIDRLQIWIAVKDRDKKICSHSPFVGIEYAHLRGIAFFLVALISFEMQHIQDGIADGECRDKNLVSRSRIPDD